MSKALALALVLVFLTTSSIIVVLPVSGAIADENSWVEKAPMHQARAGVAAAVVGEKIYVFGGYNKNGNLDTNEEYNPATDTWTFKAPMPAAGLNYQLAMCQNKIYLIGKGINYVYNPANDSWETKTPAPTKNYFQVTALDDEIYVIENFNSNTTYLYDPANDSWTTKAPIPTATGGTVIASNHKIYVIGSNTLNPKLKIIQVYDPKTDAWSLSYTPSAVYGGDAAATAGVFAPVRIYFFDSKAVFDPVTGIWQTRSLPIGAPPGLQPDYQVARPMPTDRTNYAVAVLNDKIYEIGGSFIIMDLTPSPSGYNMQTVYKDTVEEYTPYGYGTISPVVSVFSPTNMNYSSNEVSLNFVLNKVVNWTGYILDGIGNVTLSGNTTLTGLTNGVHNVTIYAKDTFGNLGSSQTINFTIAKPEPLPPPMSFPTIPVAAVSVVAVALATAGLLANHKKHKTKTSMVNA